MPSTFPQDHIIDFTSLPPSIEQDFHNAIFNQNNVVFIVFKGFPKSKSLVDAAKIFVTDKYFGIERTIIILPDHDCLKDQCIDLLKTNQNFNEKNYAKVIGLTVDYQNHETRSIFYDDQAFDELDVDDSFYEASLG